MRSTALSVAGVAPFAEAHPHGLKLNKSFEVMSSSASRVIIGARGMVMSTFTVQIQVPEALRDLDYNEEEVRREVPVLLVLKRFRQGALSSGKGADLLGLSRREFLDLLTSEGVPVYDPTDQELADEWKEVKGLQGAK